MVRPPLEHDDRARLRGQAPGASQAVDLDLAGGRSEEAGGLAGMRREDERVAARAQAPARRETSAVERVESVGVEHGRSSLAGDERDAPRPASRPPSRARDPAPVRLARRGASSAAAAAARPSAPERDSASGSVMTSSCAAATIGWTERGRRDRDESDPGPERARARASTAAPDFPTTRPPPSRCPIVPLCASRGRSGARRAAALGVEPLETRRSPRRRPRSGMPMSSTRHGPAWDAAGSSTRHGFGTAQRQRPMRSHGGAGEPPGVGIGPRGKIDRDDGRREALIASMARAIESARRACDARAQERIDDDRVSDRSRTEFADQAPSSPISFDRDRLSSRARARLAAASPSRSSPRASRRTRA